MSRATYLAYGIPLRREQAVGQGWTADPALDIAEGARLLRLALNIDANDSDALSIFFNAEIKDNYSCVPV
jgi:hypothetical protein